MKKIRSTLFLINKNIYNYKMMGISMIMNNLNNINNIMPIDVIENDVSDYSRILMKV